MGAKASDLFRVPADQTGAGARAALFSPSARSSMRSFTLAFLLLIGVLAPAVSFAADRAAPPPVIGPHPPIWRFNGPPQDPPFSRTTRAQAVWDGGACWSQCSLRFFAQTRPIIGSKS